MTEKPREEELSEKEQVEKPTILEAEKTEEPVLADSETPEPTCGCNKEATEPESLEDVAEEAEVVEEATAEAESEEVLEGDEEEGDEEEPEEMPEEEPEEEPVEEEPEEELEDDLLGALKDKLKPAFDKAMDIAADDAKAAFGEWWGMLEKWIGEYPSPKAESGYPPPEEQAEGPELPEVIPEGGLPELQTPDIYAENTEEEFDVEEVRELLSVSAKKLDEKDAKIAELTETIRHLETYKLQVEELEAKEHEELVGSVVNREVSLGLINSNSKDAQLAIYRKMSKDDLRTRLKALSDAKPIEAQRQSLKSSEPKSAKSTESADKSRMSAIFAKVGLDLDAWEKHKAEKEN